MARYTGPVCRLCRREGCKLFLKGERCYSEKCELTKGHPIPGQHGQARQRKMSEYGLQLREKQKAKRAYGVLESQFHKYYEIAASEKGVTGENLLVLLERRLDNVVYRAGIGASRAMARQLVERGHIRVNGKKVDIPSYLVDVNDVITLGEKASKKEYFKAMRENGTGKPLPQWITFDAQNLTATVIAAPARSDVDLPIQENLIVEHYSR